MIPNTFRPLLSAKIHSDNQFVKLKTYPYVASPKIDGIRILLHPTLGPVTRTLKPLPNDFVRDQLRLMMDRYPKTKGLDGEITLGHTPPTYEFNPNLFNATQSAVMAYGGCPEVTVTFFDNFRCYDRPYWERMIGVCTALSEMRENNYKGIDPKILIQLIACEHVQSLDDVLAYEEVHLDVGYEGIMLRDPNKPYKFNRATINGQELVAVKRYVDAEAQIIGFEELLHNDNVQTKDAFGLAKRSSHKDGKTKAGTMGKFLAVGVNGDFTNVQFAVGTGIGLTKELRQEIWDNPDKYLKQYFTYKFLEGGSKDKPRHPIYKYFRHASDVIIDPRFKEVVT